VRGTSLELADQLATIPSLTVSELVERWRELGLGEPPRLLLPLLQRLLAQLLQEQVYGGLSATAVRQLEAAASAAATDTAKGALAGSSTASQQLWRSPSPSRQVTLKAGTRLVREWNGRTISVEVVDDHFVWNDATYRSLSEIARAVTGARWSGPRFFGIVGRG
jgi:hypothetical protein